MTMAAMACMNLCKVRQGKRDCAKKNGELFQVVSTVFRDLVALGMVSGENDMFCVDFKPPLSRKVWIW